MSDSLKKRIEQYQNDRMSSKPTGEILAEIKENLRKKIEDAFRGEREIHSTIKHKRKYRFKLENLKEQESLPALVSYGESSKAFSPAIEILLNNYYDKIKRFDPQIISTFTNNDPEKQKNYIKGGMGLQLMNKDDLFKKEIENIRTIQDEILNIEGDKYALSDRQRIQDNEEFEINEYVMEDLIDFKNNIEDQIKNQNKAFFWIPGELYKGKMLNGEKSDKAVYIAYFYSFLRKNSYATYTDIATEAGGAQVSGPSRDWVPNYELERPFLVSMANFMQPVFFSKESREIVGLSDRSTRCYQGTCNNDKYTKIKKKKKILWDIYELLCNPDYIHDHIKLAGENIISDLSTDNNICLELELTTNKDIGLHLKKNCYILLHIKSIKTK